MTVLNREIIELRLADLRGWSFLENQIIKEFEFSNFTEALEFVNKVGGVAEDMNHHPDIFLHSWNKVKIAISTHSEGGVTEKDFILARRLEREKDE